MWALFSRPDGERRPCNLFRACDAGANGQATTGPCATHKGPAASARSKGQHSIPERTYGLLAERSGLGVHLGDFVDYGAFEGLEEACDVDTVG